MFLKLNDKNIREIIRNIADNIIKEKYSLYIDDKEYPGFYTMDVFIGEDEEFYMQFLIIKDKECTSEDIEKTIKKAYKERQRI